MSEKLFEYLRKNGKLGQISSNEYLNFRWVNDHPDEGWNWGSKGFSENPSITRGFIERHIGKPWDWMCLSEIKSVVSESFVEKYIDKPWRWGNYGISCNPSITCRFIERHIDKPWYWGFDAISANPHITPEFIEKHIDEYWWWGSGGLSENPSITLEFIDKHIDKDWDWDWGLGCNYKSLSSNLIITPEFIDKHIDKDWSWWRLSANPSITPEFVEKHFDKDWHWFHGFDKNPSITPETFIKISKLKYESKSLTFGADSLISHASFCFYNKSTPTTPESIKECIDKTLPLVNIFDPTITFEIIKKYTDENWTWDANFLSCETSITPEFIEKHIDKNWNWGYKGISMNKSITPKFIEKYIDKPWWWGGYCGLAHNPSITPEFVEKYANKRWDRGINGLSTNPSITSDLIEKTTHWPWDWTRCNISNQTQATKRNKEIFSNCLFEIDNRPFGKLPDEFKDMEILEWKGKKVIGHAGIKFVKGLYQDC